MVIDLKLIKHIFNIANLFKLLIGWFIIIVFSLFMLYISVERRYNIEAAKFIDVIEELHRYTQNPQDLRHSGIDHREIAINRCSAIKCYKIYLLGSSSSLVIDLTKSSPPVFYIEDSVFTGGYHPLFFKMYTLEGGIIVRYHNQSYIVDDSTYLFSMIRTAELATVIICLGYLFVLLYIISIKYKNNIYEKGTYKMYVENKLQRDVTEMIHHEMNMPLAIIRTVIEDFQDAIGCKKCIAANTSIADKFDSIELAIQRIESVLHLLQEAKHIKYNYKNISIYKILENIIACVNSFNLSKIKADYIGRDIMRLYTVSPVLSSGTLLNIINVMVTNSKEAKALNIKFTGKLLKKGFMYIFIEDDGIGIRDKQNHIIKTDSIFEWGYSSKDMNGENIINKNILSKILRIFGIKLAEKTHSRGIGLYVNRSVLRKVGGDIKLLDTSENGTKFVIIIPIIPLTEN